MLASPALLGLHVSGMAGPSQLNIRRVSNVAMEHTWRTQEHWSPADAVADFTAGQNGEIFEEEPLIGAMWSDDESATRAVIKSTAPSFDVGTWSLKSFRYVLQPSLQACTMLVVGSQLALLGANAALPLPP